MRPSAILAHALSVLAPCCCLVCGRPTAKAAVCSGCRPPAPLDAAAKCRQCFSFAALTDEAGRCPVCRALPLPYSRVRYLWQYEGRVRRFIVSMKYKPSVQLCRLSAEMLAAHVGEVYPGERWDLIAPVPSSRAHILRRGFNQCDVLARALRSYGPVRDALRVVRKAPAQASLPHARRLSNVRRLIEATEDLCGLSVLLVEDVITTGATTAAAAMALLDCGARTVEVLALSRAAIWNSFRGHVYAKVRR